MARPGSSIRRLLAPLAGLLVLGALVAGCAPRGAAATVDGAAIGENDVSSVVEDMNAVIAAETEQQVLADNPDASPAQISATVQQAQIRPSDALLFLIAESAILDTASDAGLAVSTADAEQSWATRTEAAGVGDRSASEATLGYVQGQMAVAAMTNAENGAEIWDDLTERLGMLDVTISPRYGSWDPAGAIQQRPVDWIVQPASA